MRQRIQALLHLRADGLELVLVRGLGGGEFLLNTLPRLELGRGDTRVGVGTGLLGGTRGGIALGSGWGGPPAAGIWRAPATWSASAGWARRSNTVWPSAPL